MSSTFEPQDWEAEALLPARVLAGVSPAVQAAARRLERCLYLWLLEHLEEDPGAPAITHEVAALVAELATVAGALRELNGPASVVRGVETALAEACTLLHLQPPSSKEGENQRPFALQLSGDSLFRDTLHAFGGLFAAVGAVGGAPDREARLAALCRDLLWIRAVLQQHIARRGEISCLREGDSLVCTVAGILASRLEAPIAALREELEAPEGSTVGAVEAMA
jgi:hypothetical protein